MTMWHLQVHQCEDQLQELEMSSQQLLQASAEQVSFSLCMHFWLPSVAYTSGWLWRAFALIQSVTVPLISKHACLFGIHKLSHPN